MSPNPSTSPSSVSTAEESDARVTERSAANPSAVSPDPAKAGDDRDAIDRLRAETSLGSIIFLFQLLMALALTNAAYLFFTGGGNTYALRPWDSYTVMGVLTFFAFATLIIPFIHADVLLLTVSYRQGFSGKGLWPLVDFFLLFIKSAGFYALSHTFATMTTRPLDFYLIIGAILSLNVFWALLGLVFEFKLRKVGAIYAILNTLAVTTGAYLFWTHRPHLQTLLLVVLLVRNTIDFAATYNYLFPRAFSPTYRWRRKG